LHSKNNICFTNRGAHARNALVVHERAARADAAMAYEYGSAHQFCAVRHLGEALLTGFVWRAEE
jgi:hypothetical protein